MSRAFFSRIVLGAALACTTLPLPGAAAISSTRTQESFRGQIVLVQQDGLIVSVAGQHVRFVAASDTHITLNGKQARLSDLKSRDAATIWAETKGAEPVAKYIHAAMRL